MAPLVIGGGLLLLSHWLDAPFRHPHDLHFGIAGLSCLIGSWLLSLDNTEEILGRFDSVQVGVWRTTRAERLRRLLFLPFTFALLAYLCRIGWDVWKIGDVYRLAAAALAGMLLAMLVIWSATRIWRVKVELRIDDKGIFAAGWSGAIAWDEIAFAMVPARERDLRLMRTEAAFRKAGDRDGMIILALAPTGLQPNEALAALRSVRSDLPIEPWASNGFVLPIRGATDVPDTVEVTTYG